MTEPEHLPHAPIVEAVLGIEVTPRDDLSQKKLESYQTRIERRYPTKQVKVTWSGQFEIRAEGPPVAKTSFGGPMGYAFKSADNKQVVQALKNGFSFSRLEPYDDWATFSEEAKELWGYYVALTKPERVVRVGLRYINKIHLPLPITDFRDYVLTRLEIAPELPQSLVSFIFRVVVPVEKVNGFAAISQTILEAEAQKGTLPLILDIDLFRFGPLPVAVEKLWPILDGLREQKNHFFFKTITDKTKDLFR